MLPAFFGCPARGSWGCAVFGGVAGLKVWVVDGSRSPRVRGEALVDLEIPPAMGCIKAQADGIAVRRLPFRTLVSSGSNKTFCPSYHRFLFFNLFLSPKPKI